MTNPKSTSSAAEEVARQLTYNASVAEASAKHLLFQAAAELRRLAAVEAERDELREHLQFVERWANHHGQKPHVSPAEALSVIQHYPPIKDITKSYSDGKLPTTPDPWAERDRLAAELERVKEVLADIGDAYRLNSYGDPGVLRDYARTALECCSGITSSKEGAGMAESPLRIVASISARGNLCPARGGHQRTTDPTRLLVTLADALAAIEAAKQGPDCLHIRYDTEKHHWREAMPEDAAP